MANVVVIMSHYFLLPSFVTTIFVSYGHHGEAFLDAACGQASFSILDRKRDLRSICIHFRFSLCGPSWAWRRFASHCFPFVNKRRESKESRHVYVWDWSHWQWHMIINIARLSGVAVDGGYSGYCGGLFLRWYKHKGHKKGQQMCVFVVVVVVGWIVSTCIYLSRTCLLSKALAYLSFYALLLCAHSCIK